MTLPAGYDPSRYVGVLEVITLSERMLFNKKMMKRRKWLTNRRVRVFMGRIKGETKFIHSSPILRIAPAPDGSGHKLVLVENGNWYRAEVVLDGSLPVRKYADGRLELSEGY